MKSVLLASLLVGAGGFIGSILRYSLGGLVQGQFQTNFPVGTLFVNTLGCLLIGVLIGLEESRQLFSPQTRMLLIVGVLGGFTTFSTFGYETFAIARDGALLGAGANIIGHVLLGLAAVWLGYSLSTA